MDYKSGILLLPWSQHVIAQTKRPAVIPYVSYPYITHMNKIDKSSEQINLQYKLLQIQQVAFDTNGHAESISSVSCCLAHGDAFMLEIHGIGIFKLV